jgi:hypothetical protein
MTRGSDRGGTPVRTKAQLARPHRDSIVNGVGPGAPGLCAHVMCACTLLWGGDRPPSRAERRPRTTGQHHHSREDVRDFCDCSGARKTSTARLRASQL